MNELGAFPSLLVIAPPDATSVALETYGRLVEWPPVERRLTEDRIISCPAGCRVQQRGPADYQSSAPTESKLMIVNGEIDLPVEPVIRLMLQRGSPGALPAV